eukprot:Lankesteria_metandrocarpae@DN10394_c0_g1_i1.p1
MLVRDRTKRQYTMETYTLQREHPEAYAKLHALMKMYFVDGLCADNVAVCEEDSIVGSNTTTLRNESKLSYGSGTSCWWLYRGIDEVVGGNRLSVPRVIQLLLNWEELYFLSSPSVDAATLNVNTDEVIEVNNVWRSVIPFLRERFSNKLLLEAVKFQLEGFNTAANECRIVSRGMVSACIVDHSHFVKANGQYCMLE